MIIIPGAAWGQPLGCRSLQPLWEHRQGGLCVRIRAAAAIPSSMTAELPAAAGAGLGLALPELPIPGRTGSHPHPSAPRAVLGLGHSCCCLCPCQPSPGPGMGSGQDRGRWAPLSPLHSWGSAASSETQTSGEGAAERKLPSVQRESCERQLHGLCV